MSLSPESEQVLSELFTQEYKLELLEQASNALVNLYGFCGTDHSYTPEDLSSAMIAQLAPHGLPGAVSSSVRSHARFFHEVSEELNRSATLMVQIQNLVGISRG